MPLRSRAQAAYFAKNRKRLEKQGVDVREWFDATDFSHLPARAERSPSERAAPQSRARKGNRK